jgi:hypothetical protein
MPSERGPRKKQDSEATCYFTSVEFGYVIDCWLQKNGSPNSGGAAMTDVASVQESTVDQLWREFQQAVSTCDAAPQGLDLDQAAEQAWVAGARWKAAFQAECAPRDGGTITTRKVIAA